MKTTLLTVTCKGNLVTFPGLTVENTNKFFPESDETQNDHTYQQKQEYDHQKFMTKMQC